MEIEAHYSQLLGTQVPWEISKVDLDMSAHRVDIEIEYTDVTGACPECGANCPKHDDRKPRSWRHLDTMQFATYLHCSVPRVRCKAHGARTVTVPWAGKNSRFTLLFEGFAVRVLQAARSIEEARKLLGLNWHQVNAIKTHAVQRGLSRRQTVAIPYLGIDEKPFRKGHRYISSLVDLQQGRVLDGVENRTEEACKALIEQSLTTEQQQQVTGVALDMWKAYRNSVEEKLPQANIVHDRFHISQHLNEAVDKVRRQENKALKAAGDRRLVGTKFNWLVNEENLNEVFAEQFNELKQADLKVSRAWAIKERFRDFWDYRYAGWARRHFDKWYAWAIRCQLEPKFTKNQKYLSIAFLSIAFLGMSANAQNLQDFIDYTESDNQLASEACLKQPVDNAVYDITITHGDESKNVLYCMNRKIFKDKTEAHCLAYEKKNGKITGTVMVKTGFNQAVMCQPTITIRNSIR